VEVEAYVVPREGIIPATEAEIVAYCRELLPPPKRPKVVIVGDEVPYTATGKPKRLELKALLASSLAPYRNVIFPEPH
jgi:long-chain acyl-CoA synthetase